MDGATLVDVVNDNLAGKALSEQGIAPDELLRLHALWAKTGGAEGKVADLSGYDCRKLPSLVGQLLVGLRAEGAIFVGLDLRGCQLQGARLAGADLRDCKFAGADMRGVNLAGAKLTRAALGDGAVPPVPVAPGRPSAAGQVQAVLRAADLRGAKFAGAGVSGIDIRDVTVDEEQFEGINLSDAV
ncbi:unnamed protein product, partial [Phaeothamnion confervicola]